MKIERALLHSRVARRIFVLFVCCAILPIAVLAGLSFHLVTRQLEGESRQRLHQAARIVGLALYERLLFLDSEMARFMLTRGATVGPVGGDSAENEAARRFIALTRITRAGSFQPIFGRHSAPVDLGWAQPERLDSGKSLVFTRPGLDGRARVFIGQAIGDRREGGLLLAEVDEAYLWGAGEGVPLPALTELCVLDAKGEVLMCSVPLSPEGLEAATRREVRSGPTQFEWTTEGDVYLASAWPIFMPSRFTSAPWTVVVSESKRDALASRANFTRVFPLVVVLAFAVVALLSVRLIRKSLDPVEQLQAGTRRIGEGNFETRVSVTSGDEFEELAGSFNDMARRLDRQFHALSTTGEITQVVLSSLETARVVDTVLGRMADICPCDRVAMVLAEAGEFRVHLGGGGEARGPGERVSLSADDVRALQETSVLAVAAPLPAYLAPLDQRGIRACAVLPIVLRERIAALIVLGFRQSVTESREDLAQARQLADEVAVALANARLVEDLDQLNWGALRALARAIDAKSSWTAGHSERVTALALKIGRAMGRRSGELERLRRGGLLHDLGKIGTPAAILEKPDRLTADELQIMRQHAALGASILEPIAAYAEVLPIVRQHHEWYDGTGYPDGLAGEGISLGARIFSVADVYDALNSDRPYRRGLPREKVIDYIRELSGRQFDPKVVDAFLQLAADGSDQPAGADEAWAPATS